MTDSSILTPDPFSHLFLDCLEGVTELYLIRHGQAQSRSLSPGDEDPPLTYVGRQQAERLAERTCAEGFSAIYSSPLLRARETALPLATRIDRQVRIHDDLREIGLRSDGLSAADGSPAGAATGLASDLALVGRFHWDDLPAAETSGSFRTRVARAISELILRHPGQRIAVVCHGGVINACICDILGLDTDMFFLPSNTSISIVRALGQSRVVHRLNDYEHLLRRSAALVA